MAYDSNHRTTGAPRAAVRRQDGVMSSLPSRAPASSLLQSPLWRLLAWAATAALAALLVVVWTAGHAVLVWSLVIFLAATLGVLRLRPVLPDLFACLLVLAALANAAGGAFAWFETIAWYDEAVHAFTGLAGLAAIGWLAARTRDDRRRVLVAWCAALGLLLGIGWEVVEGLVGDLEWRDTVSDLVLDTLGAALGGLAARRGLDAERPPALPCAGAARAPDPGRSQRMESP